MPKLYVVSFEGLNVDLIQDWGSQGHLPNFKHLCKLGFISEIQCSKVPYESSGLFSAFSGLDDRQHNVISYWKVHNRNYTPAVWRSDEIEDQLLWRKDALSKLKVGLVNLFSTHPPRQSNGYTISYAMERTLRYTYPANLLSGMSGEKLPYVQDMAAFYQQQSRSQFINEVSRVETRRHDACKMLMKQEMDIFIVNYTCVDRLCHFYMNELTDNSLSLVDKAVFKMYQQCDKILGDYLFEVEHNNDNLMIISSVGFGTLKEFVEINPYLAEKQLLSFQQGSRSPDWKNTIAFESVQGSHGVNINRRTDYQDGVIEEHEYQDVRKYVMEILRKMENPYTGNPMFSNVCPGEDYYICTDNIPDILLEPYDLEFLPYGDTHWADIVNRHSQTGWHRSNSVWGGIGPDISGHIRKGYYSLASIAPTIHQLMGSQPSQLYQYPSLIQ